MPERPMPLVIHGRAISPGLAEGMTYVHRDMLHIPNPPVSIETKDVDQEFHHLERSTALITENLLDEYPMRMFQCNSG